MDILFWVGAVGVVIFGVALLQGIRRAGAHHERQRDQQLGLADNQNIDPADQLYMDALRSGDPEKIAKAPLPKFFSGDLLLEGLNRIQNQPSLYDQFLERITEQFGIRQRRILLDKQSIYNDSLEKEAASYNEFLHRGAERPNLHRAYDKQESADKADIAEQNLREAQARRAQEKLWEPEPSSQSSAPRRKTREELEAEITKKFEEELKIYEERHGPDSPQVKMLKNEYQDRIRRLFEH